MANVLNDRYELIEALNSTIGDFDTAAYKARERMTSPSDVQPGRVVLLRRIPVDANLPTLTEAASRASAIGRDVNVLDFYGIAELSGSGGIPPGPYIATEYVRGISLRERIRRVAPFSLSVTLDIALAICHAVHAAAQHDLSHGHLCPEQVILTPEGQVKVADFAIAQAINDVQHSDHEVPGSDVRAIGLILFEMLTGSPPASISDPFAHSPKSINATVPAAMDGITRKALSANPKMRYPSAEALITDLQTARDDLRSGKPLAWTPLNPAAARPTGRPGPGLLTQAASEIVEEDRQSGKNVQYDDYYEPKPSGMTWLSKLVMVLFVLVILGIIGAVVVMTTVLTVPSDTVVPNMVGKLYPDAQAIAKSNHFNLVVEGHGFSDVWPVNAVTSQTVPEGRQIKSGKEVGIEISDGPPLLQVPDITQDTIDKAKQLVVASGLPLGTVTPTYSDVVPPGIVTGQDPQANAMVSHKTPVNISVSKGPSPPEAPTGLSASATVVNEIDLSWNEVADATSYNVYRDGAKVFSGLTQTSFSDMRLGTNRSHNYTVTAVNVNGKSAQSAPASATTLSDTGTPVDQNAPMPAPTAPAPDTDNSTSSTAPSTDQSAPRQREFHIRFRVPSEGSQHNVQIEVQDATGTNVVYDENRDPGRVVDEQITGLGNIVIIRVYLDGKLIKQETK